jgi:hypothetical protein
MTDKRRIITLFLLICAAAFACGAPDAWGANWKKVALVQVGLLPYCDGTQRVSLTVTDDGLENQNVYFISTDDLLTDNVLLMALTALKRRLFTVIDYQESTCPGLKYTSFFTLQSDPVAFKGDVDGNLSIDLADAILALRIVAGSALPNPGVATATSDVNNDRRIGIEEVIYILQKVANSR